MDVNGRGDVVEVTGRDPVNLGDWTQVRVLVPAEHHKQREEAQAIVARRSGEQP